MTVEVTQSSVSYIGNGSQTVFAYQFRIFTDTNLNVYIDDVLQTYITDYSVTNNGDESGGTVVFVVAPENATDIQIDRVLENKQLLDLIEYDRFPAESVEAALDFIVFLVQQNTRNASRAVQAPTGLEGIALPNPGAGEFIKYTDDGTALETADILNVSGDTVPVATDTEIIEGTQTQSRFMSPSQVKLGVESHETAPLTSVYDVQWVSVVDVLPATPVPNTMYLVRN